MHSWSLRIFLLIAIVFTFIRCSGSTFNNAITLRNAYERSEKTFHIKPEAHVLDIFTIELRFDINGELVASLYLSPSGQSRSDVIVTVVISFSNQIVLIP